jgi:hypothetical protein
MKMPAAHRIAGIGHVTTPGTDIPVNEADCARPGLGHPASIPSRQSTASLRDTLSRLTCNLNWSVAILGIMLYFSFALYSVAPL